MRRSSEVQVEVYKGVASTKADCLGLLVVKRVLEVHNCIVLRFVPGNWQRKH